MFGRVEKIKGQTVTLRLSEKKANELRKYTASDSLVEIQANGQTNISPAQRRKVMALCGDISNLYNGERTPEFYKTMKSEFMTQTGAPPFSLSYHSPQVASQKVAGEFIDWLIDFCFKNGVRLSTMPLLLSNDLNKTMYSALMARRCVICGKPAVVHHFYAVGSGANRDKINQKNMYFMSLCNAHHNEIHHGVTEFMNRWHVVPIKLNDDDRHTLKLGSVDTDAPVRENTIEFDPRTIAN